MALTYRALSAVTVGSGGAVNIEFTNIPQGYTDLCIKYSLRGTTASLFINNRIRFNDSTSGYTAVLIYGNGSTITNITQSTSLIQYAQYSTGSSATGSTFSNGEIYIPNYAGSNNKSMSAEHVTENNGTEAFAGLTSGLWANTSAITKVSLAPTSGNFAQYSTATLYVIQKTV
jgi:hypothetical protein